MGSGLMRGQYAKRRSPRCRRIRYDSDNRFAQRHEVVTGEDCDGAASQVVVLLFGPRGIKSTPMKASVFIATSLDGFIARPGGEIDWLGDSDPEGVDYGFAEFFGSVDCLVMGRNSYEVARSFGDWPYGSKQVVVLTSRPLSIPDEIASTVEAMAGVPQTIVDQLAERGLHHLYIDGGRTIQAFLDAGLIQRMTIARIPILIGDGIPLFGPPREDIMLRHIQTQSFANGIVQSEYHVG